LLIHRISSIDDFILAHSPPALSREIFDSALTGEFASPLLGGDRGATGLTSRGARISQAPFERKGGDSFGESASLADDLTGRGHNRRLGACFNGGRDLRGIQSTWARQCEEFLADGIPELRLQPPAGNSTHRARCHSGAARRGRCGEGTHCDRFSWHPQHPEREPSKLGGKGSRRSGQERRRSVVNTHVVFWLPQEGHSARSPRSFCVIDAAISTNAPRPLHLFVQINRRKPPGGVSKDSPELQRNLCGEEPHDAGEGHLYEARARLHGHV